MKDELDLFLVRYFYNELSCGCTSVEHVLKFQHESHFHIKKYAQAGTFNKEKKKQDFIFKIKAAN
jgi:hypothetical protein